MPSNVLVNELTDIWIEPPPDSLKILDREHVMLFDVEDFWTQLAISLDYSKGEIGDCCGVSYRYNCIPSFILKPYVKNLLPGQIDWVTLTLDQEIVIIVHYVVMVENPDSGSMDVGSITVPKINIKTGLIADSNLIVAKIRMMGDQIIQENLVRREAS